jgi:hypothetical protein
MDASEIRLRLVEAAARTPAAAIAHSGETARVVLDMARAWEQYVLPAHDAGKVDKAARERATLGLPK